MNPLSFFDYRVCTKLNDEPPMLTAPPPVVNSRKIPYRSSMRVIRSTGSNMTDSATLVHSNNFVATYCKVEIPGPTPNDPPSFLKINLSRLRDTSQPGSPPSVTILTKQVAKTLQLRQGHNHTQIPPFMLKYEDNDGDLVDLVSDDDLMDGLKNPPAGGLKVFLFQSTGMSMLSNNRMASGRSTNIHQNKSQVFRSNGNNGGFINSGSNGYDHQQQMTRIVVPSSSSSLVMGQPSMDAPNTHHNHDHNHNQQYQHIDHQMYMRSPTTSSSMSTPVRAISNSMNTKRSNRHSVAKQYIELSLLRRPNAFVRIDLNDILEDGSGSASYFMLIESIIRHFSLPKTVELTLFLNTHGGQLREIAHDLDLSEQLSLASNASSFIHIQIVDAVVSIGKRDGTLVDVPLGSVMGKDGQYSFQKLVNQARMANPGRPIKLLAHLNTNGSRKSISNDYTMANVLQKVGTVRNITIHPIFQQNPLNLAPSDAKMAGECTYGEDPPRVRLCANNAVAYWNLGSLAPGRYFAVAQYYRGAPSGSVYISAGVASKPNDDSLVLATHYRRALPEPMYLKFTGTCPNDANHYGTTPLGEFELPSDEEEERIFCIVAQESGQPYMSIRNIQLTYMGI